MSCRESEGHSVFNTGPKEKTWEETGEKYSVLTSAGELYAGVMSIGSGFAALAWYRKPIYNQVVKFFSNGHSSETTPLIGGGDINHSPR